MHSPGTPNFSIAKSEHFQSLWAGGDNTKTRISFKATKISSNGRLFLWRLGAPRCQPQLPEGFRGAMPSCFCQQSADCLPLIGSFEAKLGLASVSVYALVEHAPAFQDVVSFPPSSSSIERRGIILGGRCFL
jgi:hypothetical protein